MNEQSPSPEFDFLMTPPRLSGHQLLKIWLELRREFWVSTKPPDKDSPEWRLYMAITQRFTDEASLLKECFVTLTDPNNE